MRADPRSSRSSIPPSFPACAVSPMPSTPRARCSSPSSTTAAASTSAGWCRPCGRPPREIIAGIREQVGRELIVGYRMGTDEFTPGGLTIDDSARMAGELAADGLVDYLSLSQGNFNSIDRHLPDRHSPPATFVEQNVHIKAAAGGLPVVTSGRIETPERAEAIIASGKADVVGLCRPLIVDPDWPRKALEGRPEDIRYCISSNQA